MATTISNGFDLARVFPALQGRLGWHQPFDTTIPTLSVANKSATSGRYYDRGYKPVTVTNYYKAQEGNPLTGTDFNQLLQDEDQAAITRLLNSVFNKPALIEHKVNYSRTWNNLSQTILNEGNAVGYRINVAPGDYAVVLNSIALLFDTDCTFNVYAFNDLKLPPVYTQSVSPVANNQTITKLDWHLYPTNTDAASPNMGGVWFVCYFQNDLGGAKAIDEQLNLWADTKIFGAYPFQSVQVAGKNDFDRRNTSVNFRTYGFNMEVSSYRDYTQMIVNNAPMFDEARWLMMQVNVVETLKYSTSSNSTQRVTSDFVKGIDLDMNANSGQNGQYPFAAGLKQQLEREIQRINNNFWSKPEATSLPIGGCGYGGIEYEGMDVSNLPMRGITA